MLWYEAFISEHNIYHNNSILCSELTSERIILSECTYLFPVDTEFSRKNNIQIKMLDIWQNDTWSMNRHLLHTHLLTRTGYFFLWINVNNIQQKDIVIFRTKLILELEIRDVRLNFWDFTTITPLASDFQTWSAIRSSSLKWQLNCL